MAIIRGSPSVSLVHWYWLRDPSNVGCCHRLTRLFDALSVLIFRCSCVDVLRKELPGDSGIHNRKAPEVDEQRFLQLNIARLKRCPTCSISPLGLGLAGFFEIALHVAAHFIRTEILCKLAEIGSLSPSTFLSVCSSSMSGTYFVYIGLLPELRGHGGLEPSEGPWLPTWRG